MDLYYRIYNSSRGTETVFVKWFHADRFHKAFGESNPELRAATMLEF